MNANPRSKFVGILALALVSLAPASNAALLSGLVNYWNFDNNLNDSAHGMPGSASTVADNGTFSGANGTDGIAFTGAGLFGASIDQNGASGGAAGQENDGFVRVPRSADTLFGTNDTLTISLWVTVTGNDQDWQTMISHGEDFQYRIARSGNTATNAAWAGGAVDITAPVNISGGGWHHILAISEAGVSTRLWVDGALAATGGAPNIVDDSSGVWDLFIGANPATGAQNREWWGKIDDVAQWNRVLDPTEIATIYNGGLAGSSLGVLIPEPTSALLGLLGVAAILRRRR